MYSISLPSTHPVLRSQGIGPQLVVVNDRYGYRAPTISTGDIVLVGPERAPAIFVGVTPAGCVWVTPDALKVEPQRKALVHLWARAVRTAFPVIRVEA